MNQKKSPQVNFQLAAEQLLEAKSNEPQALLPHEPQQYVTHESLTAEIIEAAPRVHIDLSDPFQTRNHGLLIAKGHVDGYRVSVLFDTGYIGSIISFELCKNIGICYRAKPEYMSIMANQTLQETAEITDPMTLSLGFCTERMKFIVNPYDMTLFSERAVRTNTTP